MFTLRLWFFEHSTWTVWPGFQWNKKRAKKQAESHRIKGQAWFDDWFRLFPCHPYVEDRKEHYFHKWWPNPGLIWSDYLLPWASLVAQMVKDPPACQRRRCEFDPWVGKIPWRRKWQPAPVSLPGKSHGQRSLVGDRPWGHKRVRHNLATKQQHGCEHVSRLQSAVCFTEGVVITITF